MALDVSTIFKPLKVKGFTLRNRVVMPPMVSNRGIVSPAGLEWYKEHAAGGVALVIVEATAVNRFGKDLSVESLRGLARAIHDGGAVAAIQLFPVTFGAKGTPSELSPGQIKGIIQQYEKASRLCAEAGFDGVEPHGEPTGSC